MSQLPMKRDSLWRRIQLRLESEGAALLRVFEPTPPTDTVAFSISFIALAAKLAKADGQVTRDEVAIFRCVFDIPPHEEANAARVFNLCREETTGFEAYARKLAHAVRRVDHGDAILETVLDGLFHIAMADGDYHPAEAEYLLRVTEIFDLGHDAYLNLRARHVPEARDPFRVLGLRPSASDSEVRAAWRAYVRDNHPDSVTAKGLPAEMVALTTARLAAVNDAYAEIRASRGGAEDARL